MTDPLELLILNCGHYRFSTQFLHSGLITCIAPLYLRGSQLWEVPSRRSLRSIYEYPKRFYLCITFVVNYNSYSFLCHKHS